MFVRNLLYYCSSLVPLWGDACDITGANPLHYGTSVTGGSPQ